MSNIFFIFSIIKIMIEDNQKKRHIKYFIHCLGILPGRYGSYDSQRLVLTQFAVGGLSLLGGLDALKNKDEIIEWIYTLQSPTGGFFGSEIMKDLNKSLAQVSSLSLRNLKSRTVRFSFMLNYFEHR